MDIIDEFSRFLQQIFPYFLMGKTTLDPIYLLCVPVALKVLLICYDKCITFFQCPQRSIRIYEKVNRYQNPIYTNVVWYLNEKCQIPVNRLVCRAFSELDRNIYIPTYTIPNEAEFSILYKTHKLEISGHSESIKTDKYSNAINAINIAADTIQIVKDFITECRNAREYFMKHAALRPYHRAEWNRNNSDWNYYPIHTIKSFDNVFLNESIAQLIRQSIDVFIVSENEYRNYGIPHKKGFVFYGLPGSGKTSSIYAIAFHYQRSIYTIRLNELKSSNELKNALSAVEDNAVVVFEDIDIHSVTHKRTNSYSNRRSARLFQDLSSSDSENSSADEEDHEEGRLIFKGRKDREAGDKSHNSGLFSMLLEVLDGYNFLKGSIIIFTTNHLEKLDLALIRPGRIDHQIEFGFPSPATVERIFKFYFKDNAPELIDRAPTDALIDNSPTEIQISTSELINSMILPNLKDPAKALELYQTKLMM